MKRACVQEDFFDLAELLLVNLFETFENTDVINYLKALNFSLTLFERLSDYVVGGVRVCGFAVDEFDSEAIYFYVEFILEVLLKQFEKTLVTTSFRFTFLINLFLLVHSVLLLFCLERS